MRWRRGPSTRPIKVSSVVIESIVAPKRVIC